MSGAARLQASRQAAITAVDAALSAHRAAQAALPLLVVADDNMQYRSMRYEVRAVDSSSGKILNNGNRQHDKTSTLDDCVISLNTATGNLKPANMR